MAAKIFILWLILIPLIVWNGYFEGSKVIVFLAGGFFLSLFWIVKSFKKSSGFKFEKRDYWFLGWLAILTISSLTGIHPLDSILGGSYRHQGVIFFLTLWLTGKTIGILDKKKKGLLYKGIGFVVLTEGLFVLYQVFFGKLYFGRPLGTLGETNAVAGFLAIGSYFIFISYPPVVSFLAPLVIVLTQSRSGILAVLPNLFYITGSLGKKLRFVLVTVILLLAGVSSIFFSRAKGTSFFENRGTIWPIALKQIAAKPVGGYGAESGEAVFNNAFYSSGFPLSDLIIDRAHNIFLDVAMWSGLAGLFAFSGWLYFSYINLKDIGRKLAFFSFLTYAFFQPLSVVHWLLLVLII